MEKKIKSPILWISTLYFAMGIPYVTINTTSGIMFKNLGISDSQIAFWTALIMLPWTLKPLWSPFLEIYKTRKFFVIITQLICGILFSVVIFALPLQDFFKYSIAILGVIAISGLPMILQQMVFISIHFLVRHKRNLLAGRVRFIILLRLSAVDY